MDPAEGARDPIGMLGLVDAGVEQRLGDGSIDREAWVERVERVLEYELRLAAEGAKALALHLAERRAVEGDRAGGRLGELQHQSAERGLSAARLAHDGDRVARADVEADAIERVHGRVAAADDLAQRPRHREVLHDIA